MSGRPKGTTRAKKPIFKTEYERLLSSVYKSHKIKSPTKNKFVRAFTLLYITGCRVSEIIDFKTSDLQYIIENNEYSLTNQTKTKKPRLISFDTSGKQVKIIEKILPPAEVYLFAKNRSDSSMTVSSLTLMLNKYIQSILGNLYSTHSFRQGYITIAHQQGLSLEHIREDIGHKNISTTATYTHVSHKEISEAKNFISW